MAQIASDSPFSLLFNIFFLFNFESVSPSGIIVVGSWADPVLG